jgi:hypothetical protein
MTAGVATLLLGFHFLADPLASVAITKNEPVLGHPAQTVDLAYARWAVADTITAIDLVSATLGRLRRTHPHPQTGREMDFGPAASLLIDAVSPRRRAGELPL